MEEIFINIMERIAEGMPELSLIDEDYGQLEMSAEEDRYPVTFSSALMFHFFPSPQPLAPGPPARLHSPR